MENQMKNEDEYKIIFYHPTIDSEKKNALRQALLDRKKSIHFFDEFEAMFRFCESLEGGFLFILPNDLLLEENLLKELKNLKDVYKRKLADFEAESVISGISCRMIQGKSFNSFLFYTRKEFGDEVFIKEDLRLGEIKMTRAARDFFEEFLSWESHPRGQLYQPGTQGLYKKLVEKDHLECKEWCMRRLKELVFQRKTEKIKMIYYMTLAESKRILNEGMEALGYFQIVLATFLEFYGEKHPSTASAYNNLGIMKFKLCNLLQTQECHIKALNIRKAIYGETHCFTADSYNNYGLVLDELGQSQKGIEYNLKALEIYKSVHGEKHLFCATAYSNIGGIYEDLKENEKAIECYMKALEIRKSFHGETDSRVAKLYQDIASAYENMEEYQTALEFYCKALEIRKLNNEEHLDCSITLYNEMGTTYYHLEQVEKAAEYLTKALEILKSTHGENNFEVLRLYNSLAAMFDNLEDYPQALEYYLRALSVSRTINGEMNQTTETLYKDISDVYGSLGYEELAAQYLTKALYVKVALQGEMDVEVANWYEQLAGFYEGLGNQTKVLYYNLKALNILRVMHGEDDPSTEVAYESLETIYNDLEKYQKEMVHDKKSLVLEKSLVDELPAELVKGKGKKIIVYKERGVDFLKAYFSLNKGEGDFASQKEEISEPKNQNENEENSILGKRSALSEDSLDDNSEPEVEKKIKQ